MSYLELAKRVEAGLRGEKPLDAINAVNAKTAPHHFGVALPYLFMPLDEFQARGCPLEIRVPWLDVTLWFVPSEADAEALAREGVSRGRIWTARELMDLLSIPGLTKEQARMVALAKVEFAGEVVEVRGSAAVADPEGTDGWHQGGDLMDPLGGTIDAERY